MNLLVVLQDYIRMLEPAYRDPTDEERSEYSEIMDDSAGATVPAELAGRVSTRTLVLVGGASPAWTIDIGRLRTPCRTGSTVSWKIRSTSCLPGC